MFYQPQGFSARHQLDSYLEMGGVCLGARIAAVSGPATSVVQKITVVVQKIAIACSLKINLRLFARRLTSKLDLVGELTSVLVFTSLASTLFCFSTVIASAERSLVAGLPRW